MSFSLLCVSALQSVSRRCNETVALQLAGWLPSQGLSHQVLFNSHGAPLASIAWAESLVAWNKGQDSEVQATLLVATEGCIGKDSAGWADATCEHFVTQSEALTGCVINHDLSHWSPLFR